MLMEDQGNTLAFLSAEAAQSYDGQVDTIETHISVIILCGESVWKLKRAVCLPYVDFSTPDKRLKACLKEVDLNRRTAPMLYRGVRRITRQNDGRLCFDGCGELIDAVVEMKRFKEDGLFDRLCQRGELTPARLTELARAIGRFHAQAVVNHCRTGAANMAAVLDINERAFAATQSFPHADVAALIVVTKAAFDCRAALLDRRERAGKIRRCHGDLHLRNICLVDGAPTMFDCLEFDDAMATIDVLYDLAFLIMDLWHRGLAQSANFVLNRYLDEYDEGDGIALLPFFMSVRAAIRAHVTATRAEASSGDLRGHLANEAQAYLVLARDLLKPKPARLVAIGGVSGTGKSTLAAAIADRVGPAPGARIVSSDRIRKRLHAVSAETRLPDAAYCPEVSERVYAALVTEARTNIANGHGVIADAVFDRPEDRQKMQQIAAEAGVAFQGLWLEAPSEVLVARVTARRDDPSDATVQVVRAQLARGSRAAEWQHIDTLAGPAAVAREAVKALDSGGHF
jgi:aminoglycoside phosphotransferase family enzyme/predicted kinase